jgi:hypothetical protein
VTLESCCFPDFVLDIAEIEVRGYLSSYHLSVVSLLKLLLIINDDRDNKNEVYEFVLAYSTANLVPDRQKILFSEDDFQSGSDESGVDNLTLKQVDIDLKELF